MNGIARAATNFFAPVLPAHAGDSGEPLWAELFSAERLEQHAESLAKAQTAAVNRGRWYRFALRSRDNAHKLTSSYLAISEAVKQKRAITPAADWLLNNFHVIEEQLRDIHTLLPRAFYRELPKLDVGPLAGLPRVYGLAWAFVAHTDSRFDPDMLLRFLRAYQHVQPLTIGELWALPIMLRIVMVENLRRLAVRIIASMNGRAEADQHADKLLGLQRGGAVEDSTVPGNHAESLSGAYVVQMLQRLRYPDANAAPVLQRLNASLAKQGASAEQVVQRELNLQAAANVSVRNIITSMRLVSAFDWDDFFEAASPVNAVLSEHPGFVEMDFSTRDSYRHAVELLAAGSPLDEIAVARAAVARANLHRHGGAIADERRQDTGFYLIDGGRLEFENEINFVPPLKNRFTRGLQHASLPAYLGVIIALTFGIWWLVVEANQASALAFADWVWLAVFAAIPASDIALTLVNRFVIDLVPPRHLPRLALTQGLPLPLATFVVVPTFLSGEGVIDEQMHRLETRYLANAAGEVYFALLTDWPDAAVEELPGERELLLAAGEAVKELNRRYGRSPSGSDRFYLFHRRRLWNPKQGVWMGWERKRGKLHEFNRLLRGAADTSFILDSGYFARPPSHVRFVLTLDADTILPMDVVIELVGALAHPLNRPRFDPATNLMVEGYGILQPRVTSALPSRLSSSPYQRLFSGRCGVDPYTFQVSDVYQDLFKRGTFTGKGLYEVDTFERALGGRVPANTILSHDLFESVFARCAFVSDIELFEEFPPHTEAVSARAHRWARGDWQLLPWVLGIRGRDIPAVGRWKMFDNLRRTLLAPATVGLLIAAWLIPAAPRVAATILVIAVFALPPLLPLFERLLPRPNVSPASWLRILTADAATACGHVLVQLTLLAHQACLMVDAIARTLLRLVRKRRLLEWTTAAQVQASVKLTLSSFVGRMRVALALTVAALIAVVTLLPSSLPFALPFIALWLAAPLIAWRISQPPAPTTALPITIVEVQQLRLIARRTWRFFATFVTPTDHFLPPDNYQEVPTPVVAHRSSPTNYGLYLLSAVAAHDFGWIGIREMTDRLEATMASLAHLPRYRGHFYNWTDTAHMRPLEPKYISTVDSGNLAGMLLALEEACLEWAERPLLGQQLLRGINDDVQLLREAMRSIDAGRRTVSLGAGHLSDAILAVERLLEPEPATAAAWTERYDALDKAAEELADIVRAFAAEREDASTSETLACAEILRADISAQRRDLRETAPWAGLAVPFDAPAWILDLYHAWLGSSLNEWPKRCNKFLDEAAAVEPAHKQLLRAIEKSRDHCFILAERLHGIAQVARTMFNETDFQFLFDPARKLFSIGYQVDEGRLDAGYYDLLASEARLTSFIAIAKHDVPAAHWFRLGRTMVPVGQGGALVSWSGSMFEYLMPSLVMYTPHGSLLDETCRLIVDRQIEYGSQCAAPWGVSESAYNKRDLQLTYQYSNFGVPGLGLKRGLGQDVVIAPYATALAAMYDPGQAIQNFTRLESMGALGHYGFYEALDFTSSRRPEKQPVAIVRAYMAHHQGMSLISLVNVVMDGVMRRRFHRQPMVHAAELLLQETRVREGTLTQPRADQTQAARVTDAVVQVERHIPSPHSPTPVTHLLSNGSYAVMITAAGSGYSRWRNLAVTRWREDPTLDCWGAYLYLRDTASGRVWSATYQPTVVEPQRYNAEFAEDRVRITRSDYGIESALEIIVSAEDDAEIRRLTLKNTSSRSRDIEITSYAEIVLNTGAADMAHPAFSNLFVQTEYLPEVTGLLATRRPRSADEPPLWFAHVVAQEAGAGVEFETDRSRFLGRGRNVHAPLAVIGGRPLSNTVGAVLDPIASLRVRVSIPANATVRIAFSTMMAESRENIINLADKYHDPAAFERASTLAWTHAQVQLHHLGIDHSEANLYQQLAGRVLYADSSLRPSSEILQRNQLPVNRLWQYSISGDRPIVLARVADDDDHGLIRQLLNAHEYWHMKKLEVDLVFINEQNVSYAEGLQQRLQALVAESQARSGGTPLAPRGNIFVLRADLIPAPERDLLQTAARAIVVSRAGNMAEQVSPVRRGRPRRLHAAVAPRAVETVALPLPPLEFANGLGGFTDSGREYVVVLERSNRTPLPWLNVIANASFGFQVSESGSGYTWAVNSRENQLTPWSNDPVTDPSGEIFYLRDMESGALWTPTAAPIRHEEAPYIAHFGAGYARFEHRAYGISSELRQFVAGEDTVKISELTLSNQSSAARQISVTAYVEWVLGASRVLNAPFIITEMDAETGAIFARNPWNSEFGGRVAFAAWNRVADAMTCDRTEFIGRNGSLDLPAALVAEESLSGRCGAGFDPCAALQRNLTIPPGAEVTMRFLLGQAPDADTARLLLRRYRAVPLADVFGEVKKKWDAILDCVRVETPDRALDVMLNRWLLYQTIVCRLFARAAFYQAGGAYGFRDQLQDVMALTITRPDLTRAHIVRASGHQFAEGDVQHWWHPPTGRGVRTHFSDDRLWLPFAVAHYVRVTGDRTVLDEVTPFLDGLALPPEREDIYFEPAISAESGSVFEHCARALDVSLKLGSHNLPLIGGGDWNDGMNRIGAEGRGESVWLGWFLYATLEEFTPLAVVRGEAARADRWRSHANNLRAAIEDQAWDGAWYKRAYFDDGTPLGSAYNTECRIDSIAQSWAVLSGAADRERALRAMESVDQYLIKPGEDIMLLFAPPFDKVALDPGYIKGYVPGVRENGGQYTHAAVWCVIAHTLLDHGDRAAELFAMLNPINHASTRTGVHRYKVEPYVIAADVYGEPPHTGRGGWTWYTGAAGWMYRAGVEYILGFKLRGNTQVIDPCIPYAWPGFKIAYRYGATDYEIEVDNPQHVSRGIARIHLDGRILSGHLVPLSDDGLPHRVEVTLGDSQTLADGREGSRQAESN